MKDGTLARFDWKTPYQLTKQKTFQNEEDNTILQKLILLMEEKGGKLDIVCPSGSGGSKKKRKRKTKTKTKRKTKKSKKQKSKKTKKQNNPSF